MQRFNGLVKASILDFIDFAFIKLKSTEMFAQLNGCMYICSQIAAQWIYEGMYFRP